MEACRDTREAVTREGTMNYEKYIEAKQKAIVPVGFEPSELAKHLFPYQADLTRWALNKGRSAIFADTGLGKTAMQIEWARQVSEHKGRVLILAPLAVADQTVREAKKFGVEIQYRRLDVGAPITITNYEMADKFDPSRFAGIVLDESSILKSYDGKMRTFLIEHFAKTPYRLACTATPSPNDYTELGNHSQFLGIKTRSEMLAEYFVHDMDNTQDWRLKGHAIETFWRWVAGWGALIRKPSDLGYSDEGFNLPALNMHEHIITVDHTDAWQQGQLLAMEAISLNEQRASRRATMQRRVELAKKLAGEKGACLIWCELNDEGDAIEEAIEGCVQVAGADSLEAKTEKLINFSQGETRVLVTKASIAGFGMNWQHCNRMIFLGASHSYEQTYQAIRRCWRFGQKRPVDVHIIRASTETAITENFKRKEADAQEMAIEMTAKVKDVLLAEIRGTSKDWNSYAPSKVMKVPAWIGEEK